MIMRMTTTNCRLRPSWSFETMTFRLDTVDTDKNIPSFYIRTEDKAKFLYFATDSADSKRVADWRKYTFAKDNEDYATRLIFKDASIASLQDADTLQTMVDGKLTKVAVKENKVTGVKGGLNNFKFQVIESGDGDGTYVIRNAAERAYVISVNGNQHSCYFRRSSDRCSSGCSCSSRRRRSCCKSNREIRNSIVKLFIINKLIVN